MSRTMTPLKLYKNYCQSPFLPTPSKLQKLTKSQTKFCVSKDHYRKKIIVRGSVGEGEGDKKREKQTFLTLEEAGLVEISSLSTHERFLCRLTVRLSL